jgi:prepilin-type N-terminal cleavage/methylation domain-containing protein
MAREKSPIAKSSSRGFTLLELATVIMIGSVMLVSSLAIVRTWMKNTSQTTSQQRMAIIQLALDNYETQHNRLPCPASFTAVMGTSTFGRENSSSPCTPIAPGVAKPGRSGATVIIGALPVRDLGLGDSYIANTNQYRYTYAVTLSETSTTTPLNGFNGAIDVEDGGLPSNSVLPTPAGGTALYVVVDHGADGKGAYNIDGKASVPCTAGTGLDVQNCNLYASGYFRSARFSSVPGPNWFDDTIIYEASTSTANTQACTTVFGPISATGPSLGWTKWGDDVGVGGALGTAGPWSLWYIDALNIYPLSLLNPASTTSDAYCPTSLYYIQSGGCTTVSGGAIYGLDLSPRSPFNEPYANEQIVMPASSHPAMPDATGSQGWECNGSSASQISVQAYATCCVGGR